MEKYRRNQQKYDRQQYEKSKNRMPSKEREPSTVIEEARLEAHDLIEELLPNTGKSIRIGISGTPGVGKSTFI